MGTVYHVRAGTYLAYGLGNVRGRNDLTHDLYDMNKDGLGALHGAHYAKGNQPPSSDDWNLRYLATLS